jgi:hypothetical protein
MSLKPLEQLRHLAARIQNLPTTGEGARELGSLIPEAISLLTSLEGQSPPRLALRCQVSRQGLQTEVQHALTAYEQASDHREKITRMTQARAQAHYLLWQVLAAAAR